MTTSKPHAAKSSAFFLAVIALSATALLSGSAPTARADRTLLSPTAHLLSPDGFKVEYLVSPYTTRRNASYGYFQFSTPEGIEFEASRFDLATDTKKRYALNIQYPLLADLGATPSISVGIRDLFGTGIERQDVYLAAGKLVPLSDRQARLIRELRWSAGFGTGNFDGLFLSVQTRLRCGLSLSAELWRYRPNIALAIPLHKNVQARAYSLDGAVFYGITYTLAQ